MNTHNSVTKNMFVLLSTALILLCSQLVFAFDSELEGTVKDAWLTGKAETVLALNKHLNRYSIAVRVDDGVAHLTGEVGSSIDKSLASELMNGINDIEDVNNQLRVNEHLASGENRSQVRSRRSFARWIDDITTTAIIRSKLVANGDVGGLAIDVSTREDVVTLSGEVHSEAESALAEEIARNSSDVATVKNRLLVSTAN